MYARQLVFSCFSRLEEAAFPGGHLFPSQLPLIPEGNYPRRKAGPGPAHLGQATWGTAGRARLHKHALPHPGLQLVVLPWLCSAEIAWKMSSCGVFNINSRHATGIQALRGCAFLQGFRCPEKTLEFCLTTGSAPAVEGVAGSVHNLGMSPRWRAPSVLPAQDSEATQAKRVSSGAISIPFFYKRLDNRYFQLCRLRGFCYAT